MSPGVVAFFAALVAAAACACCLALIGAIRSIVSRARVDEAHETPRVTEGAGG
jgi:hypothetical protein